MFGSINRHTKSRKKTQLRTPYRIFLATSLIVCFYVNCVRLQFGEKGKMYLVRFLNSCVMVRVGGGWETLPKFLENNDPCRGQLSLIWRAVCSCFRCHWPDGFVGRLGLSGCPVRRSHTVSSVPYRALPCGSATHIPAQSQHHLHYAHTQRLITSSLVVAHVLRIFLVHQDKSALGQSTSEWL